MGLDSATSKAYNVLLERNERIVSTKEIKEACKLLKVDFNTVFVGLKRWRVLVPIVFKGVYYLKNREEKDLGTIKEDPLIMVAKACSLKLGEDWYFGLATALQLAGLWEQQTLTTLTVISKKRVAGLKSKVAGMNVEFKQIKTVPFDKLIMKKDVMRYSEPSRTILDYAYFAARNKKFLKQAKTVFESVASKVGGKQKLVSKSRTLVDEYPRLYTVFLKKFLEMSLE